MTRSIIQHLLAILCTFGVFALLVGIAFTPAVRDVVGMTFVALIFCIFWWAVFEGFLKLIRGRR